MIMIKRILLVIVLTTLILPGIARGEAVWLAEFWVSYNNESGQVMIGADRNATEGYERGYDAQAIFYQGSPIMAYFYRPEWGQSTNHFWMDIRNVDLPKEWRFAVVSKYGGASHVINWVFTNVPATLGLTLVDEYAGVEVNLKEKPTYVYVNASGQPRYFIVKASGSIKTPDTIPPETAITSDIPEFTGQSDVLMAYSGLDNETQASSLEFSYSLDAGAWSEWSKETQVTLSALSEGSHSFSVKARDEAGNEDLTPATVAWTIDTTPPALSINAPSPAILWPPNKKMVDVIISGSANDGASGLASVDYAMTDEYGEFASSGRVNAPNGGFSFNLSLKAWREGSDIDGRIYTITIIAIDKAGNEKKDTAVVAVPHDSR